MGAESGQGQAWVPRARTGSEVPTALQGHLDRVVRLLAERTAMRQWTLNRRVDDEFVVLAASPLPGGLEAGSRLPWSQTLCSLMTAGTGPHVAGTLAGTCYESALSEDLQAYAGFPVLDGAGRLLGTLSGTDARERGDLERYTDLVALQAESVGLLLAQRQHLDEQARQLEHLTDEAETDALTGVGNRRAWDRVASREQGRLDLTRGQAAVLTLDLDGLKRCNDTHGHAAGDALLTTTARVLVSAVRGSDFVARLGGDEFAVLLGDTGHAEAGQVLTRLRTTLAAAGVQASTGLALTRGRTVTEALRESDLAMYDEKRVRLAQPSA